MLRKAVVVETPQLGHATYVFAKPRSMDSFLSTYTKIRKDDVRRNRNNAAERLGFLGRVVHGTNPRTWLKEIPKPETHAMLLPTTQTKTFAVIGHQAAGSGTTTRESGGRTPSVQLSRFSFWRNKMQVTNLASGLGDFNLRELLSWLLSSVGLAERKAYLDRILQDKPKWLLRALAPVVSKIQNDIGVWLGTAYEDVPGSGPLQRFGVINNRSANQTRRAGVTDSSPARPSGRTVARFHQF